MRRLLALSLLAFSACIDPDADLVDAAPNQQPSAYLNSVGMVFLRVPAGSFMMGSTEGQDDERPVHRVTISRDFFMGISEVTQGQYAAVMGENPSLFTGDDARPVEQVTWFDAVAFVQRLNERENTDRYRLPTEAEWEYAARAGSETAYHFGADAGKLGDYAWNRANADARTHPVGRKQANAFGLHDMAGNVWEWVHDWHAEDYYGRSPEADPTGPVDGLHRVIRGGSVFDPPQSLRSANRGGSRPVLSDKYLGFRVVRTVD